MRLSYRRADLAGFWVVVVATIAASTAAVSSAVGARAPWLWAAAAGILVLVPGLFRPRWFEFGVWAWNGSARHIAAVLRRYVLAVGYYTILAAVGNTGAALDLAAAPGRRSMWVPPVPRTSPGDEDRSHGLLTVAAAPGRAWAIALFPLVFLLDLLKEEQQDTVASGSTYTLY